MFQFKRNAVRNKRLFAEHSLLLIIHIVVVIHKPHVIFAGILPTFEKMQIRQTVAIASPFVPLFHRDRNRICSVESFIGM